MLVRSIETQSFRNLADQRVEPGPRFNVLSGDNAQGKTNFIEAVYVAACLKSFRAQRSAELVRLGAGEARLRADIEVGGSPRRLEVLLHRGGRRALLDGKGVRSGTAYLEGGFNVVLFTPDDVQLPRGSPAERRRLLDRAVTNIWPAYLAVGREYHKTLQSRNRVLRDASRYTRSELQGMLAAYDEQLGEKGARVVAARQRFLTRLGPRFSDVFHELCGGATAGSLRYVCPPALEQAGGSVGSIGRALREELARALKTDRARQTTTVGPHTHDLEFRLDGRATRSLASQGQHRALVLAFKITQVVDAFETHGDYPVLLLDDVSSELDPDRNRFLFDFIKQIPCQAFLSTTRPELVVLAENRFDYHVVNGTIRGAK